jgi:hypothetical protein
MPRDVEIVSISTQMASVTQTLPTANAVLGTTADTELDVTLSGLLKRTEYRNIAAGTTIGLTTAAYLERMTVVPVSTGAATVTLSDGTTAILSIPAAAHAVSAAPYTIPLGIRSVSTLGFRIACGASVSVLAVGGWVGTPTTA